jgi:hypothetical protein
MKLNHADLKCEILNSKLETISKFECLKLKTTQTLLSMMTRFLCLDDWNFGHLNLFRISIFVFRIFQNLTPEGFWRSFGSISYYNYMVVFYSA